jgi:hypothetical protein
MHHHDHLHSAHGPSQSEDPRTSLRVSEPAKPRLLLSGLDSLYVSYYFDLRKSALDFDQLAYAKERLRESRREDIAEVQLGTERFAVMPYGKHPYAYVLSNEAFEVRLGENMSPSCHVQFSSQSLWQCGLDDLIRRFDSWCDSVNLTSDLPEVVSRADWAFDYHLPIVDFTADDFVSRLRKDSIHRENGSAQTFTRGRGAVVFRIYDKVAEIEEQSQKFWFFELWGRRDGVWRVEMQVRRERLREGGIDTIADLRSLQNDLLRELCSNHTTLRRPGSDTNKARWALHPLWEALLEHIDALPQSGLIREIDPKRSLSDRIYYQGRSLYGNLKGLAALLSERDDRNAPMTLPELLNALMRVLTPHHNREAWQADVLRRVTALRLGQW